MCVPQHAHCCCQNQPDQPPRKDPPASGDVTAPTQECACTVVFRTIEIHDDGETGKAEWQLEMVVNGVVKRWDKGSVGVQTFTLDREFRLPNCTTPINIRVSGWEKDPGSKSGGLFDFVEDNDDKLSDVTANHPAPAADPTVLRSYEVRTSNATGDYTIRYDILKTCKEVRMVSARQIVSDMTDYARKLKKSGVEFKVSGDEALLNSGLNRLRRAGWRVTGTMGELFVLEGYMPVLRRPARKVSR